MRFFILISLLCSIAFSTPVLNGAEATQTITINSSSVAETNGHFLYQLKIPRTGLVATTVDSANDVAITRVNDTTRHPRWVVFTTDTIYLYADLAVSSTVDTSYRLQYGQSLNEVNASATFTNCGYANFFGFDELSGSTTIDYASAITGNVGSSATLGVIGYYNKAVEFTNNENSNIVLSSDPAGTGSFTYSSIFKLSSAIGGRIFDNGSLLIYVVYPSVYVSRNGATLVSSASTITVGDWFHVVVTSTSTGETTIYINGAASGTPGNAGTPKSGSTACIGNRFAGDRAFEGLIDRFTIQSGVKTPASILDMYNTLFNTSTFSTLGVPDPVVFSAEMGIDTLRLVCSAEGAVTYQWYDNNVAVTGETDSVYTIYADSVFYSTKHVIYCLVNGSVISDSWVIRETASITGTRRSGYRQINMGQGMH